MKLIDRNGMAFFFDKLDECLKDICKKHRYRPYRYIHQKISQLKEDFWKEMSK